MCGRLPVCVIDKYEEAIITTEKQRRFCDEYIKTGNATQAAVAAGYSPKTAKTIGGQNLSKLDLRAYIDERLAELQSERTADAQEVLEYLTSVMRGEHTEPCLRLCGDGAQCIDYVPVSERDRLKAAELIGKRYGMFDRRLDELAEPLAEAKKILEGIASAF